MFLKEFIRNTLNFLHLDLTKNLEYDRLTKLIMHKSLRSDSNAIDIGCHKGEILDHILKLAPHGKHFAFEPLPHLFQNLTKDYGKRATIFPYALSDQNGQSSFQFVKNDPAYSGIKKRRYDIAQPEIEEITVELRRLDELIPVEIKIDFIKIDVEGAEFGVLKGAEKLLLKDKPIIVFECGLGASDYYGTDPGELFDYLTTKIGLSINTLKGFVKKKTPLKRTEFLSCYQENKEYYYIAYSA